MSGPADWKTIPEILPAARLALSPPAWAFSGSGPETEVTVRRNRAAFDRLALMPRVLRGVADRDLCTTFLGHRLSVPVMFAPVGSIGMFHPEGAQGPARVAERVGTMSYVATNASPSLEEVRAVAEGPLVFQLYVYGDREWLGKFLRRVENAGYDALCLTVDSPDSGQRDRRFANYGSQWFGRGVANFASDPEYPGSAAERQRYLGGLTWEDVAWVRDQWKCPLILKGVLSHLDAELAVEHGVDVIHVSNHGGRRQDQLPSTIEVLPQVLQAVNGRADVVIDSGFMRGTDVVKALAMGARAVLIGKLMIWSLAAGGEPGLERAMELLRREISATMANVGASTIAQLTPDMVVPSFAPPTAPWPVEPMDLPDY
jgi:isopentenyl diphosphate isomerase/L-lactate dehydrogenase-like FMN-dependent dehydrogenase